jgi:hypothetical protein
MRKKDWADESAEKLQDVISEGDDQQLIEAIAEELRSAFLQGTKQKQVGTTTVEMTSGDVSRYYCTQRRAISSDERAKAVESFNLGEATLETMLTWDGAHSAKKAKRT